MNSIQIEKTVLAVLSIVLKQPYDFGDDVSRQNTPNWDSLKHIEILFALEDELGVEFSEDELASLDSVQRIVKVVEQKNAT